VLSPNLEQFPRFQKGVILVQIVVWILVKIVAGTRPGIAFESPIKRLVF
jgi:hypothetical protein